MNPQEKNWQNLFGQYTADGTIWHALTTVYSLDLAVIRAYKFTRKFSTNPDFTVIYHHNTYYFSENNIKEQSWQIEKEKCNQRDGVVHPEAENMRAIDFGNNTSIWVSKALEAEGNFGSEVFFKQQNGRHGIIPVYQNGKLDRLVIIKEYSDHFPGSIDQEIITDLSGTWQIQQIQLTPDLQKTISERIVEGIEVNFSAQDSHLYYLPEKILLQLPDTLTVGQGFKIIVGKQSSNGVFSQITSQYDDNGQLSQLISSEFKLQT